MNFPVDIKWFVLAIALIMYLFVILQQNKKIIFTTFAALIIILCGIIFPGSIFKITNQIYPRLYAITYSFTTLINWNVLMIYIGSMIIAALFIYSKMPASIADFIVTKSPRTSVAIILILAMTGIISIFVENVATVLVMAPIALALCKKLKINPTYFMIGLAVMSNLEGTATLVGDPPSMIFASYAGYSFNEFFIHSGKISIFFFIQAGLIVGCLYFYIFFSKYKDKPSITKTKVISLVPFFLLLFMIIGLATISFLNFELPYLSGLYVFSLGVIGLIWYKFIQHKSQKELWALIKDLDWETIVFLVGIFIVVGAISETGLLSDFAQFLTKITGGNLLVGFVLIILVSVIISGFVDNVPYIIVMLPVADSLATQMALKLGQHPDYYNELYMFALLIGSCLGGNLTPFGASANVVSMGILKKEGYPINFAGWLKVGGIFTLLTTATATILLWLVWT